MAYVNHSSSCLARGFAVCLLIMLTCIGLSVFSNHLNMPEIVKQMTSISADTPSPVWSPEPDPRPPGASSGNSGSVCYESPYTDCGSEAVVNVSYSKRFGQLMKTKVKVDPNFEKLSPGHTAYRSSGEPVLKQKSRYKVALFRNVSYMHTFDYSQCPYSNCEFVGEKIDETVDLVVVNGPHGSQLNKNTLPKRWPHQVYAMWAVESPVHMRGINADKSPWRHAFNLTMMFRRDADIFTPNGILTWMGDQQWRGLDLNNLVKKKKKTALWIASNCRAEHSKRNEYVRELKKYIDIDIIGGCGTKKCTRKFPLACVDNWDEYKFYLSFENSFCHDYVTEKVFKVFRGRRLIVPVVRGGTDYGSILPSGTYIDAAHFKNAKELATELIRLGNNHEEYIKMLQKKLHYKNLRDLPLTLEFNCEVCEYLNRRDTSVVRYYDLKQWIGGCDPVNDI